MNFFHPFWEILCFFLHDLHYHNFFPPWPFRGHVVCCLLANNRHNAIHNPNQARHRRDPHWMSSFPSSHCRMHSLHQNLCVRVWGHTTWQMGLDGWGRASCSALVSPLRSGRIYGKSQGNWQQLTLRQRGKIFLILLLLLLILLLCHHLVSLENEWILAGLRRLWATIPYCCLVQELTQAGPHPFQERKQLFW